MVKRKKGRNHGFSLVEILIGVGMAGVVALGISMMMVSSTRSYTNTQMQLSLQSDAQIVMNSVSDYLLQGNNASFDATNHKLTIYHSDGNVSTFEPKEIIWHDINTKKVYIFAVEVDTDEAAFDALMVTPTDELNKYLLGENVESFTCTPPDNGIVNISMKLSIGTATYEINDSIKIRNEIKSIP